MIKNIAIATISVFIISGISTISFAQSADDVRDQMIRQSIAAYSGSCPCPYNTDRAGRKCGKRSAYSRPGGESPLCYPSDITDSMVRNYQAARR